MYCPSLAPTLIERLCIFCPNQTLKLFGKKKKKKPLFARVKLSQSPCNNSNGSNRFHSYNFFQTDPWFSKTKCSYIVTTLFSCLHYSPSWEVSPPNVGIILAFYSLLPDHGVGINVITYFRHINHCHKVYRQGDHIFTLGWALYSALFWCSPIISPSLRWWGVGKEGLSPTHWKSPIDFKISLAFLYNPNLRGKLFGLPLGLPSFHPLGHNGTHYVYLVVRKRDIHQCMHTSTDLEFLFEGDSRK